GRRTRSGVTTAFGQVARGLTASPCEGFSRRRRGKFHSSPAGLGQSDGDACLVERAPCLPSRMWCISSRTNSPAWVEGAFPSRLSSRARSRVSCSGIIGSFQFQFLVQTNLSF